MAIDDPDPGARFAAMRVDYSLDGLDEATIDPDPFAMFSRWLDDAAQSGLVEPNAMVLATVDPDGCPSARAVLLKEFDDGGFVFFTNYQSRKGHALEADPRCALLFGWFPLQRQVRIEGTAHRVAREETEQYFASRPRDAQLGAWASPQSQVVASRAELDGLLDAAGARFAATDVPAPAQWGGYRVVPESLEFWQGRHGRMHDRLRYRRAAAGWQIERLAP